MNNQQVMLIQGNWQKVLPIADQAAQLFYGKLFELDPSLRALFRSDMSDQGRKLMAVLNTVVTGLDRLDRLVPAVEDLGRRHVRYGVQDRHYDTVGAALIWTLEQGLGDEFTPEAKDAWLTAYGILSRTMQQAARQVA